MKTDTVTTVRQALELSGRLQSLCESWKLDGELLLAFVLGKQREYLFTWPDAPVAEDSLEAFKKLLDRRSENEPVAYLVGKQAFWDFELEVNSSVLIPRPETEVLVEKALELAEGFDAQALSLADLGTGSGAIAIALAKQDARWKVTAVDKSVDALAVAKRNARKLEVDNIAFVQSSWCEALDHRSLDIMVANPPYVEAGDAHLKEESLPFEPLSALVAASHGLADIQEIVEQSTKRLRNGGWLLVEHGYDQADAVADLLQRSGFENIGSQTDLAGIARIAFGQWQQ